MAATLSHGRASVNCFRLAWGLTTYFVVPVMVLDGCGARQGVRRSAATFRTRWGEQVTGEIAIGAAFVFAMIPGFLVGGYGFVALDEADIAGGVTALVIAAVLLVPLFVAQSALTSLFQLELYRYATTGEADGLYPARQLEAAIRPKKKRWWRR